MKIHENVIHRAAVAEAEEAVAAVVTAGRVVEKAVHASPAAVEAEWAVEIEITTDR